MSTGYAGALADAFEQAAERTALHGHTIRVGGVEIGLAFAGPALEDAVLGPLRHLTVDPSGPADAHISLWDTASTGVPPPAAPWSPADVGPLGQVRLPPLSVLHQPDGGLSVLDPAARQAFWWTADAASLPWWERGAPQRSLLHWLLSSEGRHLVHAAAAGVDGRGVLLAGPSGSGKSTLALACLRAGLAYAGDDYVVVEVGAEAVVARSLYATAKVTPQTSRRWPHLVADLALTVGPAGEDVPDLAGGAKAVASIPPERVASELEVVALGVPRLGEADRLEPISRGAALRALAPSSILQLPGYADGALGVLAELVRRVPSVGLVLGDDPVRAVGLVRRLIEEGVRPPSSS